METLSYRIRLFTEEDGADKVTFKILLISKPLSMKACLTVGRLVGIFIFRRG
jgi:hypothetical protein